MSENAYASLVKDLQSLSLDAGRIIMQIYAQDFDVNHKADKSVVTEADQKAEQAILAGLEKIAPGMPVVAEESVAAGQILRAVDRFFLVDPLDGTKSFVRREGEFTVNIALIENREPVAGVVLAPAVGRLFGGAGTYAFEQTVDVQTLTTDGSGAPCSAEKAIRVRTPPPGELIGVASRSHNAVDTDTYFEQYGITKLLASSSSLKFCVLAAGEADIYPRHGTTMEWDTAAGHAVLAAAGGGVSELDGDPLLYGKFDKGLENPYFVARGGGHSAT